VRCSARGWRCCTRRAAARRPGAQQFGGTRESLRDLDEEDPEDEELFEPREVPSTRGRPAGPSAREELERRLAEARARRRVSGDLEEPLA
jgi:hypothetical protein